jgi:ArsR family transcriptional regulator
MSARPAAQAYFQTHAADWDSIRALHVAEADVEAAVSSALGDGPFDLFVDLGTGTGRMLELFGTRFRRGLGLDLSPAMLAYARAKLERAGLPHVQVRQTDIYDLPLADHAAGRRGHAPGAALPERSAARHPRSRPACWPLAAGC